MARKTPQKKPVKNPGFSRVKGAPKGPGGFMSAAGKGGPGQAHEKEMTGG